MFEILEILIQIFIHDLTVLVVSAVMIVFLVSLILDYRQKVFIPLMRDLSNVNKVISSLKDTKEFSENIENIKEVFSKTNHLYFAWEEFFETLIPMRDSKSEDNKHKLWSNTKRPSEYFNFKSFQQSGLVINRLDIYPNLFIGAGLLFTFIGLALAIFSTSQALAIEDNLKLKLQELLSIASLKFFTSIVAIFCSILLTVYSKSSQSKINNKLEQVLRKLELGLQFLPAERLQIKTINAITNLSDDIRMGVSDGIQNIAGSELEKLASTVSQFSNSISESKSQMSELSKSYTKGLFDMQKSFETTINQTSEMLNEWVTNTSNSIQDNSKSLIGSLSSMNKSAQKTLDMNLETHNNFNDKQKELLDNVYLDTKKLFDAKLNSVLSLMDKFSEDTVQIYKNLEDKTSNFEEKTNSNFDEISNTMQKSSELLVAAIEKSLDNSSSKINDMNEIAQKLNSDISYINKLSETIIENFNNEGEKIRETSQSLDDHLKELNISLDTNVKKFTELNQKLDKSDKDLLTKQTNAINNFQSLTDKQFLEIKNTISILNTSIEEFTKKLNQKNSIGLGRLFGGGS